MSSSNYPHLKTYHDWTREVYTHIPHASNLKGVLNAFLAYLQWRRCFPDPPDSDPLLVIFFDKVRQLCGNPTDECLMTSYQLASSTQAKEPPPALTNEQKIGLFEYLMTHDLLPFKLSGQNGALTPVHFYHASMFHGVEPDGTIHT